MGEKVGRRKRLEMILKATLLDHDRGLSKQDENDM
jgi:hypothetical protein